MRNKLKLVLVVAGVILGMVIYKGRFDKHERDEKSREDAKLAAKRNLN